MRPQYLQTRIHDFSPTETLHVNFLYIDERDIEPEPQYSSYNNDSLCFLPTTIICPSSHLETNVLAQFDDGATPSIIHSALARALKVPVRQRDPALVCRTKP